MAFDLIVTLDRRVPLRRARRRLRRVQQRWRRMSPERRRLRQLAPAGGPADAFGASNLGLVETASIPASRSCRALPKSPEGDGPAAPAPGDWPDTRVRRPSVVFALANLVTPACLASPLGFVSASRQGWMLAMFAAAIGYLLPGMLLARQDRARKAEIRNGLPDALDLFIVCVEAGCGLDQAIVKASDELGLTHPALAYELRLITTEIRAGKPRMEAFKNFAARTKVDDVQSLVAMLVQTDKFGTSVAQALRMHAETSRTKRRQDAEERAAKVGVKLVFPLVLFLFPALYIVILGPAVITFVRVFHNSSVVSH